MGRAKTRRVDKQRASHQAYKIRLLSVKGLCLSAHSQPSETVQFFS